MFANEKLEKQKGSGLMNTNFPLKVVCPKCRAAVSAKCTEKKLDGSSWVNYFHFERIEKAKAEGFDAEKSA
jgi:hypothetical protein